MGFWGMSRTGKDAQGKLNEIPNWQWDQAKTQWGNANDFKNRGDQGFDWAQNYWKGKANGNFADPNQIKASGEAMMPGVQEAIGKRAELLQQKQNNWNDFAPKAGNVTDQINANLDQQGGMVGQQWDTQQGAIKQGTDNLKYLADGAYGDTIGSIKDSFGAAGANMNAAYDSMGNRIDSAYGGLLKDSAAAYDKMGGNVESWGKQMEMLKPGGEFATAQTARAFAPAMAAAGGRLRRGGVDPNGLQAASVLGGVEANRARAMDDSMARGTETYVNAQGQLANARNSVIGGGLNSKIGLTTDMTGQQTSLGRERAGYQQGLDLGQGEAFRGAVNDNRNAQMGIESADRGLSMANNDQSFGAGMDVLDRRNSAAMNNRTMSLQDLAMQSGLTDQQMAEELTKLGLTSEQMNAGLNLEQLKLAQQNLGAGQLTDMSNADYGRGFTSQQLGNQSAGAATQGYGNTLSREAANAGWGTKLLLGAGSMAADFFAPGSGQLIRSAGSAAGVTGGKDPNPFAGLTNMIGGNKTGQFDLNSTAGLTNFPGSMDWQKYSQYMGY